MPVPAEEKKTSEFHITMEYVNPVKHDKNELSKQGRNHRNIISS